MSRTLYRLEGCPYCERVVDRLDELGLDYESVWVEGMHSRRDAVREVSGQREVPVLVDKDRGITMAESGRILEYLDATYGGDSDDAGSDDAGSDGAGSDDAGSDGAGSDDAGSGTEGDRDAGPTTPSRSG